MNWRFRAGCQVVRELARRGEIGDIYHAKSYVRLRSGIPKFGTWFCRKELAGAGALFDTGVHFLDLCLYLVGNFRPVAVTGATYTKFGNRGLGEGGWGHSDPEDSTFDVDDFATAIIKFDDGLSVGFDVSWVLHQDEAAKMNVDIFGTEGGLSTLPPRIMRFGREKGEYEVTEPQGVKLRYPHCNRFHNWLDAITGDDELEVTPEQALTVQRILDAILESSASGREVRL
jgi:predicted dehydrogenase